MRSDSFPFMLAPLRRSLCFGAKTTQMTEGGSGGGKEGLREEETSRLEVAVEGRTVGRRWQ